MGSSNAIILGLSSLPPLIQNLVSPTEKTAGSETVHDDYCEQRPWIWLQKIDKTEDNTDQTYTAYAAPTPLAQPMVECIRRCTY
jgi:hypothetical protein